MKKLPKQKQIKAWGILNLRDKTLFNFAMPVEDIEEFYEVVARTKKEKTHERYNIRVVPVTISYQLTK